MGNSFGGIKRAVEEEFERVRLLGKEGRQYIVLDQVLQIENTKWESYPIDFTHLGTLFMLDKEKNGKFTIYDFMQFMEICRKREEVQVRHDFKTHMQAYFTLCMWSVVAKPKGVECFIQWIKSLFGMNAVSTTKATKTYSDDIYYSQDTLKTLYNILAISQSYGIEWRQFYELMCDTSKEKGLPVRTSERVNYIHEDVLKLFSEHFIRGFVNLMMELGFDPEIEVL